MLFRSSYLEVLDTQRQLFSAEIDLAESRRTLLLAFVELYRALGGGWSDDQLRKLEVVEPGAKSPTGGKNGGQQ